MNKQTNRLLFIACIGLLCSHNYSAVTALKHDAIHNFVDHALEQLLGIGNEHDQIAREDITLIKERVASTAAKPTLWERMSRKNIERTSDEVKNDVYTGIIDFIEEQSYTFAFEKTNNAYIASKVSKNMHDFIANRIAQKKEFKPGGLARFVGKRLREAILEQCTRYSTIRETTSMCIVKCRICLEKFLESACLALSPCGHIVCKKCAQEYFFGRQNSARCPRCAKAINIDALREKIVVQAPQQGDPSEA